MRARFDSQLEKMHAEFVDMLATNEKIMELTLAALQNKAIHNMMEVSPLYEQIEELKKKIEARCLKLLLQQQPVATDLRRISGTLKMVNDIDRIGQQMLNVNEILEKNADVALLHQPNLIHLATLTQKMLQLSITAYIASDLGVANEVIALDDTVDKAFKTVKKDLIAAIKVTETEGESILDTLLIAKYFEKISDHAENFAYWVIYLATGQLRGE